MLQRERTLQRSGSARLQQSASHSLKRKVQGHKQRMRNLQQACASGWLPKSMRMLYILPMSSH